MNSGVRARTGAETGPEGLPNTREMITQTSPTDPAQARRIPYRYFCIREWFVMPDDPGSF